jgi:hypothetical protein
MISRKYNFRYVLTVADQKDMLYVFEKFQNPENYFGYCHIGKEFVVIVLYFT